MRSWFVQIQFNNGVINGETVPSGCDVVVVNKTLNKIGDKWPIRDITSSKQSKEGFSTSWRISGIHLAGTRLEEWYGDDNA